MLKPTGALAAIAIIASTYAAHVKHYSTFHVSRPLCAWIQKPRAPKYRIIPMVAPNRNDLALCKLVIAERFQMINPNTGRVAGLSKTTAYPLLVMVAFGKPDVYDGGPVR